MAYKDELATFLNLEALVERFFVAHLETYTGYDWRSLLLQADDIGHNHNVVICQQNGSVDAFDNPTNTGTGEVERNIFSVSLQLQIQTTIDVTKRGAQVNNMNAHQQKVGYARAAMLHGSLATSAESCPFTEIIGFMSIGQTLNDITDQNNLITYLNYNFDVGYKSGSWPVAAQWILTGGVWSDTGIWDDNSTWIDAV